jgi:hypothetical protein
MELDFEIDKLTHSIENVKTGGSCLTGILPFTKQDLPQTTPKTGWKFNWEKELKNTSKEVFKLFINGQSEKIHGLVSFSIRPDHIFMDLIENSPENIGKNKVYRGVAGNLVAFVCKISFAKGFEGFVAFDAKTALIKHYNESLGAFYIGGQRMIIETEAAKSLVNRYYPDFF